MIIRYIRHSITEVNEAHLSSGCLIDSPLSKNGIALMQQHVKDNIYPKYPGICYASELSRTKQTLKLIYPNAQINQTYLLNERCFGVQEYMNQEELQQLQKQKPPVKMWELSDIRMCEDAESTNQFLKRVKTDFSKLLDYWFENETQLVTIAGHGGYLKGMAVAFNIKDMPNPNESICQNGLGIEFEVTRLNSNEYNFKIVGYIGGTREEVFEGYKNIK